MTGATAVPPSAEQLAADLAAAQTRIDELTRELDDTNRGIIALHTDLEAARAAEARAVADQEVAAERDRIAAELREQVIQKIFAAGMSLHGVLGMIPNKVAAGRVRTVVADLDTVIAQLRAAVFGAQEQPRRAPRLSLQLNDLIGEARHILGYTPSLGLSGPIDETVPAELAAVLLTAVQTVLSGLAESAARADIHVEAAADELRLVVDYDRPAPAGEDFAGRLDDARLRGGTTEVGLTEAGARLTWCVPLPERA